jgi:hypothetical protein
MIRKILAGAAAVPAVAAIALAGPASADSASYLAYHQNSGGFSCTEQVHDDGDGGTLSVRVAGREVRPESDHFRTAYIKTRIVAEEKTYDGSWKAVKYSKPYYGHLGATIDAGEFNVSPFVWDSLGKTPKLTMRVWGYDDLFRLRVVTRVFSDEDAQLARLVTHEGTCRV